MGGTVRLAGPSVPCHPIILPLMATNQPTRQGINQMFRQSWQTISSLLPMILVDTGYSIILPHCEFHFIVAVLNFFVMFVAIIWWDNLWGGGLTRPEMNQLSWCPWSCPDTEPFVGSGCGGRLWDASSRSRNPIKCWSAKQPWGRRARQNAKWNYF